MPVVIPDYYTGFDEAEVVDIFNKQKSELKKCLASYATNGDSVVKRRIDEINLIIAGCQKALKRFDPTEYGRRHRTMTSRIDGHINR